MFAHTVWRIVTPMLLWSVHTISHLKSVPGFQRFNLLQGSSHDDHTLFSSHATWDSKDDFDAWIKSDAFKKAHANAGSRKDIYMGPPQIECFEVVL